MSEVHSGHRYLIINKKSGTALDLNADDGHTVAGWDVNGNDNQKWEANEEEGFWRFKSVFNDRWLAVEGDGLRDGLRIVVQDEPFNWRIFPDDEDSGVLRILIDGTPFNVDLSGHGDAAGGTPVELWGRWQADNQCWRFEPVDE